jgi:P4 family phage/plasmid primase-like protien
VNDQNQKNTYRPFLKLLFDEAEKAPCVARTEHEPVLELRALGRTQGSIRLGYFQKSELEKLLEIVTVLDADDGGLWKGIYVTLNPVNPALLARMPNQLSKRGENVPGTSDSDVLCRQWLPIDIDPVRPSGISSSTTEHVAAINRALEIKEVLKEMGWPDPVVGDSGNGAHLLYRLPDIENTPAATETIKSVLEFLASMFSDDMLSVDVKNFNAARIWKVYGTMTRKGANVSSRPWRPSKILEMPAGGIKPVGESELKQTAEAHRELISARATTGNGSYFRAPFGGGGNGMRNSAGIGKIRLTPEEMIQHLEQAGISIVKQKPLAGGRGELIILKQCPFNPSHVDSAAWVVAFHDGGFSAGCHHASCADMGREELIKALGLKPSPSPSPSSQPSTQITTLPTQNITTNTTTETTSTTTPSGDAPVQDVKIATRRLIERIVAALGPEDALDAEYDKDGNVKKYTFSPTKAANTLCIHAHLATTEEDDTIWCYMPDNGYYMPNGEIVINSVLDRICGDMYNLSAQKETLQKIKLRTYISRTEMDANPFLLCVNNGVLNLATGEFMPHSPEMLLSYFKAAPVTYNPSKVPRKFIQFLQESCYTDSDRLTLIDWMVACACNTSFPYILFLLGHGRNGKRVYEYVIKQLFGPQSVEAIELNDLMHTRFAIAELRNARVCVCTEIQGGTHHTEVLKKISGGDWISGEIKGVQKRVRFQPTVQIMLDSNAMPIFDDTSIGFQQRFVRVNMPYTFVDDPDPSDPLQKKRNPSLDEELTTPEELSGILNLIVARSPQIAEKRAIHRRENDFQQYQEQAFSVQHFLDNFVEYDPNMSYSDALPDSWKVSAGELYDKYIVWCKYSVANAVGRKRFAKIVNDHLGVPRGTQTIKVNGMVVRGWKGMRIIDEVYIDAIEALKKAYSERAMPTGDDASSSSLSEERWRAICDSCNGDEAVKCYVAALVQSVQAVKD